MIFDRASLALQGQGREASAASTAPEAPPSPAPAGIPVHAVGDASPTINAVQLRALFPTLGADAARGWATELGAAMRRRDITGPRRAPAFLAQVGHESGGLRRLVESLDYRADRLVPTFGAHRITAAQAARLGRIDGVRPADQQGIANLVYGGAWGLDNLGNMEPGDGWRFRGRGLIQITGRDNYEACAAAFGMPLDDLPRWLEWMHGAAQSAAWWWQQHGCNAIADTGDLAALTRRINGGLKGLDDRRKLLASAELVLAA